MELLNKEDYKTILEEHEVLFVVFYATWCPPCRMLRPILEEYMENNVEFDWYIATYEEYVEWCDNWGYEPKVFD